LTARITTGPVTLDGLPRLRPDAERRELAAAFEPYRIELVDRLRAEPGIAAVTASSAPPNNAPWARLRVEAAGETTAPRPLWQARTLQIDDAFLDTCGISLLAGR